MVATKISELGAAPSVDKGSVIVINEGGTTYRCTAKELLDVLSQSDFFFADPAIVRENIGLPATSFTQTLLEKASPATVRAHIDASQSPLDEDDFATDSATRPPSQQSVGAYIRELMGFSNVWQDVTASRAVNTSYTNSTGTVIYVGVQSSVTTGNPEQELEISADNGVTWVTAAQGLFDTDSNARRRISPFGPIPVYPGERYRLVAANVELWLERRPAP